MHGQTFFKRKTLLADCSICSALSAIYDTAVITEKIQRDPIRVKGQEGRAAHFFGRSYLSGSQLTDLMQPASFYIIDKAAHGDTVRNEWRYTQESDIVAHRLLQIFKWKESDVVGISG